MKCKRKKWKKFVNLKVGKYEYRLTDHSKKRFHERFGIGFSDLAILRMCHNPDPVIMKGYDFIWRKHSTIENVYCLVTILYNGETNRALPKL